MKVLIATRFLHCFSYILSVVEALDEHTVEVLFDKTWSRHHSKGAIKEFALFRNNVEIDWMVTRSDSDRVKKSFFRELRSYIAYTKFKQQSLYYLKRWNSYLPWWIRHFVYFKPIRLLLAYSRFDKLLAFIEKRTLPYQDVVEDLIKRKPDVVVVVPLNHRFSGEIEYAKAAKQLGIPVVASVLTWDTLTTKGVFHVEPDLMLAWNEQQRKELIEIHGISNERIEIVGAPVFDKWFVPSHAESRNKFCKKMGLDPLKPIVLYLGSSANIARDETWLIQKIYDGLKDVSMLVRPHPVNTKYYSQLHGDNLVVYPRWGALPDSDNTKLDFQNALKHCAFSIGLNTSGMIDAIVNNRCCVAIIDDIFKPTQEQAVHFKQMIESKAFHVVYSAREAVLLSSKLIQGEDTRWKYRREFIKNFIRPRGLDLNVGELAAKSIERIVSEKVYNLLHGQQT